MGRKIWIAAALAGTGLACAIPAWADTKAGIEAWSKGDHASAVREWQDAANQGDADALFDLGQAYRLGRGAAQDLAKAEELYAKAAALGHPLAADNYGLLLFQRGARDQALPYLTAATERGDPRAQYLMGVAHFNGALVPKDWVRAYALVSLADQQGLSQASDALTEMNRHISAPQQQRAATLAKALDASAKAARTRQNVAIDLGDSVTGLTPTLLIHRASPALAAGPGSAGPASAAPGPRAASELQPKPASKSNPQTKPEPQRLASTRAPANGPWRIQLGAFSQAGNADGLWNRVHGRAELAGHPRINAKAGSVVRLQAGGFASHSAAQATCARLTAAGIKCIPAAPK